MNINYLGQNSRGIIGNEVQQEDLVFREDPELITGGLYVSISSEKFCILKMKLPKVGLRDLLVTLVFIFHMNSIRPCYSQTNPSNTGIHRIETWVENFSVESEEEEKTKNPEAKINTVIAPQESFNPFNSEAELRIQEHQEMMEYLLDNDNFLPPIHNFNVTKKKFLDSPFNTIFKFGVNKLVDKFSPQEKQRLVKNLFNLIQLIQRHKQLIILFGVSWVLLIAIYLLISKGIFLKESNFMKFLLSDNTVASRQKNGIPVQFEDKKSIPGRNTGIFSDDTIGSVNKKEFCSKKKIELSNFESELENKIRNIRTVKDEFVKHGDEIFQTHEEWMNMANALKSEVDKIAIDRIKWENESKEFTETCDL